MKKKILIIEDDPAVADYLITLFEDNDYATVHATSAQDGLTLAQQERAGSHHLGPGTAR